jgi:hypothetical protein
VEVLEMDQLEVLAYRALVEVVVLVRDIMVETVVLELSLFVTHKSTQRQHW